MSRPPHFVTPLYAPYAAGIVSTLANYIGGTGLTLRMVPKDGLPPKAIKTLQALTDRFNEWAWQVELARTLHVMQRAKSTDGEGLAMLVGRSQVPVLARSTSASAPSKRRC